MFLVRFLFFLLVARIAFVLLRAVGLVQTPPRRPLRDPRPPSSRTAGPEAGAAKASRPGASASALGGDIVDADFEDLPNAGER